MAISGPTGMGRFPLHAVTPPPGGRPSADPTSLRLSGCSVVRRDAAELLPDGRGAELRERRRACGLLVQDAEGLLQTSELGLESGLPFFVGLRLLVALAMELLQVLLHSIQLLLHARAVRRRLGRGLVQTLGLLGLVLDVLILRRLFDFVLLGLVVVRVLGGLLIRGDL